MSKFEEAVTKYQAEVKKLNLTIGAELLSAVAKSLGPSIYRNDSETVSTSSPQELETIKKNFLVKKLGLSADDPKLDKALDEVAEAMGRSNRNKYRAIFYALLVKKFKKESLYK